MVNLQQNYTRSSSPVFLPWTATAAWRWPESEPNRFRLEALGLARQLGRHRLRPLVDESPRRHRLAKLSAAKSRPEPRAAASLLPCRDGLRFLRHRLFQRLLDLLQAFEQFLLGEAR